MGLHVYSEINLHATWYTKHNLPVMVGALEEDLHEFLREYIASNGGLAHAVGGTADHVHVAVTVDPDLAISQWLGRLKGASAYFVNHQVARGKVLEWQRGFGVVSFGTRDLAWVVDYVRNQKRHHARGTIHPRLEMTERPG
jgi:putative transposase